MLRLSLRRHAGALPLLASLALVLTATLAPTHAHASNYVGDTMDDFTLLDVDGVPVSLYDFAGDIIVVNFFATWCPGCNEEAQSLEHEIWQEYRDDGVTVLAIDLQEQVGVVRSWIAAQGVTYRVLMAPNWNVFSRFPYAGGLPYNAIIDRQMVLRYGHVFYEREVLLQMLDELTGRSAVPVESTTWGAVRALYR
ncbi:MAG: TlpA family protein disulfide reductase [bacterium]|nr:TlpA family protein disulfide reductase [bacterium]